MGVTKDPPWLGYISNPPYSTIFNFSNLKLKFIEVHVNPIDITKYKMKAVYGFNAPGYLIM